MVAFYFSLFGSTFRSFMGMGDKKEEKFGTGVR